MTRPVIVACVVAGIVACGACGGSSAPPGRAVATTPPRDDAAARERARHDQLAAAHRRLLDEQSTALAATCDERTRAAAAPPSCTPSCYAPEPRDPRAGTRATGLVEIPHVVCTRGDGAPFVMFDELGGPRLQIQAVRGRRTITPHPRGTREAEVEAAVRVALAPELHRGDTIRVLGAWRTATHPLTRERLRCVNVSHFTRALRGPLDACGARGKLTCEAARDPATHGLNLLHYRLLEARRLQAAGDDARCQQAALEAIAIARGLPRWRQWLTLNTGQWRAVPRYRTRFDGVVDEDTLFATAIALGAEAEAVHAACSGGARAVTTAAQEQAFHTCW